LLIDFVGPVTTGGATGTGGVETGGVGAGGGATGAGGTGVFTGATGATGAFGLGGAVGGALSSPSDNSGGVTLAITIFPVAEAPACGVAACAAAVAAAVVAAALLSAAAALDPELPEEHPAMAKPIIAGHNNSRRRMLKNLIGHDTRPKLRDNIRSEYVYGNGDNGPCRACLNHIPPPKKTT